MVRLAPSILSANFANLQGDLDQTKDCGLKMIHIDIMDGTFVPNISFGFKIISDIRDKNDYFFDTIVMAHPHKTGHYDIGNSVIYEQGCCCETSKMDYADGKLTQSQREGFILVYQDKFGRLNEDKTHIVRLN